MLSGQITIQACRDVLEVLTENSDEALTYLIKRNADLALADRGLMTLNWEQKELVRYIAEHPEELIRHLTGAIVPTLVLKDFAEKAELEVR